MDDAAARALLADISSSVSVRLGPGWRVYLRSRVEDRGGDGQAVKRWVERHGGYQGMYLKPPSHGLRLDTVKASGGGLVAYFAVPPEALDDE